MSMRQGSKIVDQFSPFFHLKAFLLMTALGSVSFGTCLAPESMFLVEKSKGIDTAFMPLRVCESSNTQKNTWLLCL